MIPIENGIPRRSVPFLTWGLIAVNLTIFLYQQSLSGPALDRFLVHYALIPGRYLVTLPFLPEPTLTDYLPFVTNTFLHGSWLHLLLNMWTLYLFGPAIEDRMGSGRYLIFYLVCGIAASTAHAYFNPASFEPALGASEAIAGVIGSFVQLFPFANLVVVLPILFFPLFFAVPAAFFAALWFAMQVVQGTAELARPSMGGGIAWWAHIGGFLAGLLLGSLIARSAEAYRKYYPDEGIYGFRLNGRR